MGFDGAKGRQARSGPRFNSGRVHHKGEGVGAKQMTITTTTPRRPRRLCLHPGCTELVQAGDGYCPEHARARARELESRRGTANQRGYTYRWRKYSKWYLQQPGNQVCKLRLDQRCKMMAECVDHIVPPSGPDDPFFWDENNHQAACLICNSIKGRQTLKGDDWIVSPDRVTNRATP